MKDKKVGILGAGSFGTAIANLIAERDNNVLVYVRKEDTLQNFNTNFIHRGQKIHPNVRATNNLEELAAACDVIFPVVPSYAFRGLIKELAPFLRPYHVLIHGTKGFDTRIDVEYKPDIEIAPTEVLTMSEVIMEETCVTRIGCLSGPNLSGEIAERQPAATVIASRYQEVVHVGQQLLRSERFQVFGSLDIKGIELAGILKNYIAIAAGACAGAGYGENVRALLITRGIAEMIYIGQALGVNSKAFLGLAGVGDLIATCCSPLSRNYTVGVRLARGESLQEIIATMTEAAEGIKTVQVIKSLADYLGAQAPLVNILYRIFFKGYSVQQGVSMLMRMPVDIDADYI